MRSVLRVALSIALLAMAAAVVAPAATAASPHFKRGGSPVCTIGSSGSSSTSTTCTASLAGLGNETLVVDVTVSGFAVYQCSNQGGNVAPGQNKVLVGPVTEPTVIPADQIKNGTVTFTTDPAVLSAPSRVSGSQAGCPNSHWSGVNPSLTLTSIHMTIEQGGRTLFTCSASDPDGLEGRVPLTC